MAHERIVVTTDTRDLEGVSPEAAEAILANTNPKFRMFIDEHPQAVVGGNDLSQLKPFTCPYCGTPTPETGDLVLDEWGYFHCSEEECRARLQLDESGRAIGYINRKSES